jgi:glycogen debranching enzyme
MTVTPGVKLVRGGADVMLFSRHGTAAWLCLFDGGKEVQRIPLEKNGDHFSGFVAGVKPGDAYGFRVDGPWAPELGHRFDPSKLLIDPFATQIDRPFAFHSDLTKRGAETAHLVPKSIVQGELSSLPSVQSRKPKFIYELGVKSFTKRHPSVPEQKRGTIAALAEPSVISHLLDLGVDTLELMPIHAWIDERHLSPLGLSNAWGYNAVQFFALDPRLAPGGLQELRSTIAVLHQHGLQVVIDVVFNHSGESDLEGPTLCLRGLGNATYYAQDEGVLRNDAGCGNSLSLNEPPVVDMVLRSLRYFVLKAGVDGFRFDLATALGRTKRGFAADAPLLQAIVADPVLSDRILIAEPWDVGPDGYQLGQFSDPWLEWNDKYRDDVRRFWRGDPHSANGLATRLCGSSDIFPSRRPSSSINFIAAHDGFTMLDLVTYEAKQNLANGEDNRDGSNGEVTWPNGNVRALLATLFLSRGTLMLTAGDEFGRSQHGNNNAYAQDNETTWLNWAEAENDLLGFVQELACLRHQHGKWLSDAFVDDSAALWFDARGKALDWNKADNRCVGLALKTETSRFALVLNGGQTPVRMKLAANVDKVWTRIFCSSNAAHCPPASVSVFLETAIT